MDRNSSHTILPSWRVLVLLAWLATWCHSCAAVMMHSVELEAFYNVLEALNPGVDWRSLYPDPCGLNSPQGAVCDQWEKDGLFHFTSLRFGPFYDNTPACGRNASIHADIGKLARLRSLSFYRCFAGGHNNTNMVSMPAVLGTLGGSLESLIFRGNGGLGGPLPAELGNLTSLKRLVLTENSLDGGLPAQLTRLRKLQQLDLSWNRLGGTIPASIGQLANLVILDLTGNRIRGRIPASIGSLLRAREVALGGNLLTGAMPDTWAGMRDLTVLDVSGNRLRGRLPGSLTALTGLRELYMSGNLFSGTLCEEDLRWERMAGLESLGLAGCGLGGPLPGGLARMGSLRVLDLSRNRLGGRVPAALGDLPNLYALRLDFNALGGALPLPAAFVRRLGPNLRLRGNPSLCLNSTLLPLLDAWPRTAGLPLCSSSPLSLQLPSLLLLVFVIGVWL